MIYSFFDGAKEANLYIIKSQRLGLQEVVTDNDIDGVQTIFKIGNLKDLLRVVIIDEECGNLKVVVVSLLETLTKRTSQTFYRPIDLHFVTANTVGEGISSISRWNIVNQLGKHDFLCGHIFLVLS